jgi:hypothetical protein
MRAVQSEHFSSRTLAAVLPEPLGTFSDWNLRRFVAVACERVMGLLRWRSTA